MHLGVTNHSTQVHQSGFDPFKLDYRQSSVQLNCGRVSSDERHRATDPFLIDSPAPAFSCSHIRNLTDEKFMKLCTGGSDHMNVETTER